VCSEGKTFVFVLIWLVSSWKRGKASYSSDWTISGM